MWKYSDLDGKLYLKIKFPIIQIFSKEWTDKMTKMTLVILDIQIFIIENKLQGNINFLFSRKEKLGASKTKEILKSMELLRKSFSLKMCWCGWTEEGCPLWQMWAILAEWGRSLFTYKDFIWIWTMESPDCFHSYWTQIYSKISSNGCWDQYLAQI